MHSSMMRTARLLTVSQHALCREACLPRGVSAREVYAPLGGVCSLGVSAPWGCLPLWEVSVWGVSFLDRHPIWADSSPMKRMTDRCKNIALPQLRC